MLALLSTTVDIKCVLSVSILLVFFFDLNLFAEPRGFPNLNGFKDCVIAPCR